MNKSTNEYEKIEYDEEDHVVKQYVNVRRKILGLVVVLLLALITIFGIYGYKIHSDKKGNFTMHQD